MVLVRDAEYSRQLIAIGRRAGLAAVGIAPAEPFSGTLAHLEERKALGLHDGMEFTYRNPKRSTDPSATVPQVASLIVGALRYPGPARLALTDQPRRADQPGSRMGGNAEGSGVEPADTAQNGRPHGAGRSRRPAWASVAAYARDDYYAELRAGLESIAAKLRDDGERAIVVADQNALVDREAAVRAGIGWYGKSTNVLLPGAGSYFVLGSVLTTATLPEADPLPDGCGTCRRCLDGCPTGAIIEPGVVDAGRCLAWLVQKVGPFPRQFRESLGDRIYGCDDCQEVCPPNRRTDASPATSGRVDVLGLLASEDADILADYGRWYIPKRDPRWVRRNALIVLGNELAKGEPVEGNASDAGDASDAGQPVPLSPAEAEEVETVLARYLHHQDPILRAQALWTARRCGRAHLGGHLQDDEDPIVAEEWSNGLAPDC